MTLTIQRMLKQQFISPSLIDVGEIQHGVFRNKILYKGEVDNLTIIFMILTLFGRIVQMNQTFCLCMTC